MICKSCSLDIADSFKSYQVGNIVNYYHHHCWNIVVGENFKIPLKVNEMQSVGKCKYCSKELSNQFATNPDDSMNCYPVCLTIIETNPGTESKYIKDKFMNEIKNPCINCGVEFSKVDWSKSEGVECPTESGELKWHKFANPIDITPKLDIFDSIIAECKRIYDIKKHDYAADDDTYSNFKRAALIASWFNDPVDKVFAVMIGTKLTRLAELRNGKSPKNESIKDTGIDMTNYSAIWTAFIEETKDSTGEK